MDDPIALVCAGGVAPILVMLISIFFQLRRDTFERNEQRRVDLLIHQSHIIEKHTDKVIGAVEKIIIALEAIDNSYKEKREIQSDLNMDQIDKTEAKRRLKSLQDSTVEKKRIMSHQRVLGSHHAYSLGDNIGKLYKTFLDSFADIDYVAVEGFEAHIIESVIEESNQKTVALLRALRELTINARKDINIR